MTTDQLALVAKMREYQKQYFEAKSKNMHVTAASLIKHCKAFEAKVDKMIAELQQPTKQKELF
jgi:hypothetical protein